LLQTLVIEFTELSSILNNNF